MNFDPFAPLVGQTAQGCWLGYGNSLFLEFGPLQPLDEGANHPRGRWGLWCDTMIWRLEQRDQVHAGLEDDRETAEKAVKQIDGATFVSGRLSPFGDSMLIFSDDLVLKTFRVTTEEDARWVFRDVDGRHYRLGPDRVYPEEQTDSGKQESR
jgi:hypothetical protein